MTSMPTEGSLSHVLNLLKQLENHPQTKDFVLDPKDWEEDGSAWFDEPFIYIDPTGCAVTPNATLLSITVMLDEALEAFLLDENCTPKSQAVQALAEAGYPSWGEVKHQDKWISAAVRTKYGPYMFF